MSFKENSNNYGCTIYSENQNSPISDPSAFIPNVDFIAETNVVDRMYGPDGWEYNLPVFSYLAKYTDSQDVVFNVDKRIGGTWEQLEDYAWKLAEPLGRIPAHSRTGTNRVDVNYGKKSRLVKICRHVKWMVLNPLSKKLSVNNLGSQFLSI